MAILQTNRAAGQAPPLAFTVAVDTEFHGAHTLTVQTAARIEPDVIAVQVYRAPAVPRLPEGFNPQKYLPIDSEHYGRFFKKIIVRPVEALPYDLSPVQIAQDLWDRPDIRSFSRHEGRRDLDIYGAENPPADVVIPQNLCKEKRSGK